MARLYPMLYFAMLVLVVPVESAGQDGQLTKLSQVRIYVEKMGSSEEELGLNRDDINTQVFVLLVRKLPRLKVKKSASPYVYILVNVGKDLLKSGKAIGYYGVVEIQVFRKVTINKTGRIVSAVLWSQNYRLTGSLSGAVPHVQRSLDILLTNFAAAWNKDNP